MAKTKRQSSTRKKAHKKFTFPKTALIAINANDPEIAKSINASINTKAVSSLTFIGDNITYPDNLPEEKVRNIPISENTPLYKTVRQAVKECTEEWVLLIDGEHLESKINLKKFFIKSKKELGEATGVLPYYQKSIVHKDGQYVLLKKDFAEYLLDEKFITPSQNLIGDIISYGKKCRNTVRSVEVGALSPFGKAKKGFLQPLQNFIHWNITAPIKEISEKNNLSTVFTGESSLYRLIFTLFSILSLFLIVFMSRNAGISGDEHRYINQAKKVHAYYTSFGEDKRAFEQKGIDPQHYNTQTFDNALYLITESLGIENVFTVRHAFNAIAGWLAMFFTALIVVRIMGYRAGIIALFLIFIAPRFLGHSYNNHRDIPMATSFAMATYFMMSFLKSMPRPSRKYIILLILALVSGFSTRFSGGVLLIAYLFVFAGVHFLMSRPLKSVFTKPNLNIAGRYAGWSVFVGMLGFILSIPLWPFAIESPIKNPMEVFNASSNLGVSIRQLFEGELIRSNTIPWYYIPKYIAITTPIALFIGVALFAGLFRKINWKKNGFYIFMVVFGAVFPIMYAALKVKNDYGGWRHFLFVFPYIVALAALGYELVFRSFLKSSKSKIIGAIVLVALCVHPLLFIFKNHPMEYTYFNEIMGGIDNAHGEYETDYSLNSLKLGADWLKTHIKENHAATDTIIVTANDPPAIKYYFKDMPNVKTAYTRYYENSKKDWDYGIFYCGYISPFQLKNNYWPPANKIKDILVDNTPVCTVVKRNSKEDFLGYEAAKKGQHQQAIAHFTKFLETNPANEQAHYGLASSYSAVQDHANALKAAENALKYYPDYLSALDIKSRAQVNLGQYSEAAKTLDAVIKQNPGYAVAYYFMAFTQDKLNNTSMATQYGEAAIKINPKFREAYQLLISLYQKQGNTSRAQQLQSVLSKI